MIAFLIGLAVGFAFGWIACAGMAKHEPRTPDNDDLQRFRDRVKTRGQNAALRN